MFSSAIATNIIFECQRWVWDNVRACGLTDRAPDFGSGGCRFESCHAQKHNVMLRHVAQCGAPDLASGGCGFESRRARQPDIVPFVSWGWMTGWREHLSLFGGHELLWLWRDDGGVGQETLFIRVLQFEHWYYTVMNTQYSGEALPLQTLLCLA